MNLHEPEDDKYLGSLIPEVFTMSILRRCSLALAILMALIPFMNPAVSVGAAQNPNEPYVEDVDVTFAAPNLTEQCGFDVMANVSGRLTLKEQPDGSTRGQFHYHHTFSGPGGSVTVKRVENFTSTITGLPDGTEVETATIRGTLMYHMVIPGYGSIGNNSGREILLITWQYDEATEEWIETDLQVQFDAGPNDGLDDSDYAIICEQLA